MNRGHTQRNLTSKKATDATSALAPGRTSVAPFQPSDASAVVQRRASVASSTPTADVIQRVSQAAVSTRSSRLPFLERIQTAFGRHDVRDVEAHTSTEAQAAADSIGAEAFATGNHVVLGSGSDLHTVAHEAAHVVQQRSGVSFKGIGNSNDVLEQHADAVADRVVAGGSAESLLDHYSGGDHHFTSSRLMSPIQCKFKINNEECTTVPGWVGIELRVQAEAGGADPAPALRTLDSWTTDNEEHKYTNWFDVINAILLLQPVGENNPKKRKRSESTDPGADGALSADELKVVKRMRPYGHEEFEGEETDIPFGEADRTLLEASCWQFALTGGDSDIIRPQPLFEMLGIMTQYQSFEEIFANTEFCSPRERQWYTANKSTIRGLHHDLTKGSAPKAERVKAVREAAIKLLIQANGMDVCPDGETSDYAIAVESNEEKQVEFTHWGVEVNNHTFETNPNVGIWHTASTFKKNWGSEGPITTVPVKQLTPPHFRAIRGFAAMHGTDWAEAPDMDTRSVGGARLEELFSRDMATAIRDGSVDTIFSDKEGRSWQLLSKNSDQYTFRRRTTMD